jgi:hypothetical protein
MILDRFVARHALKAIGLVLMGVGPIPAPIETARAQDAPSNRRPDREPPGRSPVDGELVRAFDRSTPRLAEFRTVALTVLDDGTSRPLADAEVRVANQIDHRTYAFRTDSRGRLRLEYPSMHGAPLLGIEVRKDGYVSLVWGWGFDGSPDPPEAWTFRLRRGTTMGGIVVAAAERPVEGAIVLLTVTRFGPGERPANATGSESYYRIPSRTGPDGRWRTDSVPPGADEVKLQLIHPDFVSDGSSGLGWPARSPNLAALRQQSDRQVLLKGLALEGQVIDDEGRPIAGARIEDSTRAPGSSEFAWCHPTDAEGRFRFHLPRGKGFLLVAEAEGYVPATQNVSPDPDQPVVTFRLMRGKRLRGRVVDPDGHPIAGAEVYAVTEPRIKPSAYHAWTDEHGRFDWDDAPAEAVRFQFAAEGYIDDNEHRLTAGDALAEITLRPAVDIRIVAIDARTREAIPRFHVQIGTHDPRTNGLRRGPRMGRSAPRRFEILLAAERGPYQLEIGADGYLPARILVPGERTVLRETVQLEKTRDDPGPRR